MDGPPPSNAGGPSRPSEDAFPAHASSADSAAAKNVAAADTPPSPSPSSPSLDAPYLYQNSRTGSASSTPLTVRQLCRLLCPPSPSSSAAAASNRIVTPDTPVIGFDPATSTYSATGWVPSRSVPILREAGAVWYYEATAAAAEAEGGGGRTVKGPVTARDLAGMLSSGGNDDGDGDGNGNDGMAGDVIDGLTRVWSSELGDAAGEAETDGESEQQQQEQQQWQSLSDLPLLRMALDAFEASSSPPWSELVQQKQQQEKRPQANGEASTTMQDAKQVGNDQQDQQTFDPSVMTYDAGESADAAAANDGNGALSKQEADDLEAFLSSTAGGKGKADNGGEEEEEEEYESDGGTTYVKDPRTGNWIHPDLAPPRRRDKGAGAGGARSAATVSSMDRTVHHANKGPASSVSNGENGATMGSGGGAALGKKRKKKGKFTAKNSRCWVYVTGLPYDTDEDEVAKYFGRVGVLDLDPETQHPKVKLYRRRKGDDSSGGGGGGGGGGPVGAIKGDGSVCYARPESVDLALQFLDESYLRADGKDKIRVQRAKFEQHGTKFENRGRISDAKRKVARLAALQAVGWDEGENGRITGGLKGLRIIVLKGMFDLPELQRGDEDGILEDMEKEVRKECEDWGVVEKITVFSKNPAGVVVVKFAQPTAASTAVTEYHGRMRKGRKLDASFWDGVTDYTVREEEKEKKEESKRLDEFGKWLDDQDLPEEFRLQVEGQEWR